MKPGRRPATETIDRPMKDILLGQIEACFPPNGQVELLYLQGTLAAAKEEGFDPGDLYREALSSLPPERSRAAPPYRDVAPPS